MIDSFESPVDYLCTKSMNDVSLNRLSKVRTLGSFNIKRFVIPYLNSNSLSNKFDQLKEVLMKSVKPFLPLSLKVHTYLKKIPASRIRFVSVCLTF